MDEGRIEIFFVGNRGVGKTTMLSVMSHYLEQNAEKFSPLYLEPGDEKFTELNKRWSELLQKIKSGTLPAGGPGTPGIIEHGFHFSNGSESVACAFVDTSGGQTYNADSSLRERVREALAVICVVDAVDLMEFPEDEARDKCAVAGIQRLLRAAAELRRQDSMAMPLKCLFILTKCEKYMHAQTAPKNAQALAEKFTACFRQVLNLSNLTSLYLPVETLGCFEFSGFSKKGVPQWRQCAQAPCPVNIYQPLCFVMSEMLEKLEDQKGFWKSLWKKLLNIFRTDDYEQYRQQLSEVAGEAVGLSRYDRPTEKLVKITSFED